MKINILPVFAISLIIYSAAVIGEDQLKVTLFYESYCPDCIEYIESQLSVAWEKFNSTILVDMVPFGNARQHWDHGRVKFECQHGPKECTGNKLHACAILQACGRSGTVGCTPDKLSHVINYVMCVEKEPDQKRASDQCAREEGLEPAGIMKCAQNAVGDRLLSFYGNRTSAFKPKIHYVPTVAINGKHDTAAENDLIGEICRLRPKLCITADTETNLVLN
uniref:Gamma-interferon-inducible lysosomal thiol reductase n=1 Tax=Cuerna arida TaxID=1464854 RepID=A0A1B6GJS6_9HEMI